jgi:hypothetical protein
MRPVFALQPAIMVNLSDQRSITEFAESLVHAVMPHIVELEKPK